MRKKEIDTVFVTISTLLLIFGVFYGIWFFNLSSGKKNNGLNNVITNEDIKDKDVKYKVKEVNIDSPVYALLANKYIEKVDAENKYTYTDFNNKKIIDIDNKLYVGHDKNLYDVKYDENTLTISYINKNGLMPIISVHKESNFDSPVYYNDGKDFYLVGYLLTDQNTDYLYYINDKKVNEIELDNIFVLGDFYYEEFNSIITHDPRYIITSNEGHSSEDSPQILDMQENKLLFTDKFDDIISIDNSMFITVKNNKSTIIDINGNSITIPYDFIEKVGDYYLVSRDKKMAVLDSSKKIISDFSIPYSGADFEYHSLIMRNYSATVFNNSIVIIPFDASNSSSELYYLSGDKKVSKITDTNIYVNNVLYSYNEESNCYRVYDESFKIMYELPINDYFNDVPYYLIQLEKVGDTLLLVHDENYIFLDYKTGEKKDKIDDYDISYTDSIKINIHNNLDKGINNSTFSISINDEKYSNYMHADMNFDNIFKKIGKTYYIFGDNKYAIITKE